MTVRTIYVSFNLPFWVDVAERLASENDWQPVMWVGDQEVSEQIQARFPQTRYYPLLDAIRGAVPAELAHISPAALDQPFLRAFSDVQVDVLKMMDRLNAVDTFDYAGRERLYYRQLAFWKAALEDVQPDLVVFSVIPHMVFDYILYELCRRSGIRTMMFESTPMRGLVFLMETFDRESRTAALYRQMLQDGLPTDIPLSPETRAYLDNLRGAYELVPDYMRRAYNEELPGSRSNLTLASVLRKLVDFRNYQRYFQKQLNVIRARLKTPGNYLVQAGKKPENSAMSRWEYELFRRSARRYMRRLETRYAQLVTSVDLEKPYIYVALSFQPERTSSPMAGVFVNQLLMVALLSQSLPDGWRLYVKEHPTQFTPSMNFRSQSGRTLDYYDDFVALPNVQLVPMTVASFDLTDHAQAVATITGSVGWEAVIRGKPVLLFGYPWYRGCEGTFQIHTQQDCLDALRIIEDGYRVDQQKLNLFVHALERTGIEGYVEPHLRIAEISDQENAALIVQTLCDFWEMGSATEHSN